MTIVPSICSLLSGDVPRGNLFVISLDKCQFKNAKPDNDFGLDPCIIHGWDWEIEQGINYLQALIKPIGPIDSIAFTEASIDIGIPADTWLKYTSRNMIPYYLKPLTKPTPLDTALHHAQCACDQLLSPYSFISLVCQRTLGKNTIIHCPEDYLNWRFHALYCPMGIRPHIDVSERANNTNPYPDPIIEEATILTRMQNQHINDLTAQSEYLGSLREALKARNAELSCDLTKALSQWDIVQIKLGHSLSAVKCTLGQAQAMESYIAGLHIGDLMPHNLLSHSNDSTTSSHSPNCSHSPNSSPLPPLLTIPPLIPWM